MMMAVWKFAPAIAAGNTVVLKPSDTTPATHDAAGRDRRRVPAARRVQRDLRRPRHRPGDGRPRRPGDGRRSPARCAPAWRSPARAADDLKRVHLELGGKAPVVVFDDADIAAAAEGDRHRRLLQRRPGLHRGHPRASPARASTTTSSTRSPSRPRAPRPALPDDEDVLYGPRQQRQPARARQRLRRPGARPRPASLTGGHRQSATPATSTSRPSSPTCARTTR